MQGALLARAGALAGGWSVGTCSRQASQSSQGRRRLTLLSTIQIRVNVSCRLAEDNSVVVPLNLSPGSLSATFRHFPDSPVNSVRSLDSLLFQARARELFQ